MYPLPWLLDKIYPALNKASLNDHTFISVDPIKLTVSSLKWCLEIKSLFLACFWQNTMVFFWKWKIMARSKFENWAYHLHGLLLSFQKIIKSVNLDHQSSSYRANSSTLKIQKTQHLIAPMHPHRSMTDSWSSFPLQVALGTNAFTFGAPADDNDSFVLDMATTTAALGKVRVYNSMGRTIPSGVCVTEYSNRLLWTKFVYP